MESSDLQLASALRLAIAAVIGLAVGLEREWSGHAGGPAARFAGVRTFLILGLTGGVAGLLASENLSLVAAVVGLAGTGFPVAAYVVTVRQGADRDGTTEAAAILVVALGIFATAVSWLIAAAAGSLVVLALMEKKRLHSAIGRLQPEELRAALQFSVLALVILPLLPAGPYLGALAIRPRMVWMVVLVFCALNFAGFIARRNSGAGRGYLLTGLLGGVISSTAVTFGFARYSRTYPPASTALASGVVAACTVLVPRVLIISALLSPPVAIELILFILPAGIIGALVAIFAWRRHDSQVAEKEMVAPLSWLASGDKSPLRLWAAIELAVIFQVAMVAVTVVRDLWDVKGLYGTAIVFGLTDVDALTVSMSTPSSEILPSIAARGIAIGILANTIVKLGISATVGSKRYRLIAVGVLLAMGVSIAFALALR